MIRSTIEELDVHQVRKEVEPFVKHLDQLTIWSRDFFLAAKNRIQIV